MAKTKISEFSSTPGNNTDIDGINIAEGCAPSGINDAIRELMSQLKDFQAGTAGDSFNGPVGTTTAAAGAFTTLSASSTVSGTGFSTYLASPPAIGGTAAAAGSFTTLSASSTVTLSGGTANGVLYLNGSKVATSGSALTFDGTTLRGGNFLGINTTTFATNSRFAVQTASGKFDVASYGGSSVQVMSDASLAYYVPSTSYDHIWLQGAGEGMRLTSTGLGIGTTPSYKLDVSGSNPRIRIQPTTGTEYALYQAQNTGGSAFIGLENSTGSALSTSAAYSLNVYHGGAYPILFSTNATERMRLDSSGNLGLGVTPSAWGTNYTALQVGNSSTTGSFIASSSSSIFGQNFYSLNTGIQYYIYNTVANKYTMDSGGHKWYTAPSGTAGTAISFTQAMTLDASGNLGVGETLPSTYGRFIVRGTGFVASAIAGDSTSETQLRFLTNTGARISQQANQPLIFDTNATERARITSGGDLLVGTTSLIAAEKLNLTSTAAATYTLMQQTSGITAVYGVNATGAYSGSYTNQPYLFYTNNTERARIDTSGNLLVGTTSNNPGQTCKMVIDAGDASGPTEALGTYRNSTSGIGHIGFFNPNGRVGEIYTSGSATTYATSSDYRIKDNPQPLTNSGAFIDALKPKTWTWKADGSKGVGFIAHEVQEVSPGSVVGEKDGEQMQAMEYGSAEFIANIIAELQQLRVRVAQLEKGN